MDGRLFYEKCVASSRQHLEAMRSGLRATRKTIEWHRAQLKLEREREREQVEFVKMAEASLAEKEGWLAEFDARHPEASA